MKDQLKKINNPHSAIYGMGFIGALIYYIQMPILLERAYWDLSSPWYGPPS